MHEKQYINTLIIASLYHDILKIIISAKDVTELWEVDHNVANTEIHFYQYMKVTLMHYDTKRMTIDA